MACGTGATNVATRMAAFASSPISCDIDSPNGKYRKKDPSKAMREYWRTIFIGLTIIVDLAAIGLSGMVAYQLRTLFPGLPSYSVVYFFWFTASFSLLLLFVGTLTGLYRAPFHTQLRHQYFLAAKSYVIGAMVILSGLYLLQIMDFPRRFTAFFFVVLPIFFLLGRSLVQQFSRAMQRRGYGIHNVVIAGHFDGQAEMFRRFHRFPELGYHIEGIVIKEGRRHNLTSRTGQGTSEREVPLDVPSFSLKELPKIISQRSVDRVFIPAINLIGDGYADLIELCARHRVKLKLLSRESEELLRFAHVRDIAGITLYAPPREVTDKIRTVVKRLVDILGSTFALLILSPIFLIVGVAILLEDGRPIIFKQKRALVKGGREFFFFKFRSMQKDAEARQKELYQKNETSGGLFMMEHDPRLTRVGRIIRRYSIDELPQFVNVLIGDMSLVGPRPLSIPDLNNISEENKMAGYYALRGRTRPGITGLWQISGRREVGFREMVLLDLYYIENQSILFDLEILFATVPVVLFGKGAY